MDPAKGVFRTVEGSTYYPNDDRAWPMRCRVGRARPHLRGPTARKSPARGPSCPCRLEQCPPRRLLSLPVSLTEDLRLLGAVAQSLELISAMNDSQLSDLARPSPSRDLR